MKDILEIWQVIDRENAGSLGAQFVAVDVNRLPVLNADKYNLQFLVTSILKLQDHVAKQENLNENVLNTL